MDTEQVAAIPDGPDGFTYLNELSNPNQLSPVAWWTKISLSNSSDRLYSLRLILHPGSFFHSVDFYTKQNNQWVTVIESPDGVKNKDPNAERFHWAGIDLAPGQNKTVLIRTTGVAPNKLAPYLSLDTQFNEYVARSTIWDGLLFGGLLALAWTAILLSLFARSRVFLILGLLSFLTLLVEAIRRGYDKLNLLSHTIELSYRSPLILGNLTILMFISFILAIAHSEKTHLPLRQLLIAWAIYYGGLVLLSAFGDVFQVYWLSDHLRPFFSLTLLVIAILFIRHNTPTRGLILAVAAFSLARASLIALEASGSLPASISNLSMGSLRMNPAIALGGFLINLALFAGWVAYVGLQRKKAQEKIAHLQREENIRLTKEVARQTKALNEALAYADEKNRQQTQIVGYISHDLRAPLATIAGYTKLMQHKANDQQKAQLNAITRSVDYQLALIEDILAYATAELKPLSLAPEPINLADFLEEIAQHATALSRQKNNLFTIKVTDQIPKTVWLDGRRLRQVLLNLLSNAAKFTKNGTITLEMIATPLNSQWHLHFIISDSGIGIAPDQQEKIFKEFSQLEQSKIDVGVGLGLYIAQSILQIMHSELRLESSLNHGSTFSFDIQATAEKQCVTWTEPQALPIFESTDPFLASQPSTPLETESLFPTLSNNQDFPTLKPPLPTREELAAMARNGLVTDIENWLITMSVQYPACTNYLNSIQEALNLLDLDAVERLALS
ncbi:MAG TPA: hypothetical protein GXX62_00230 [Alcaligenaceae bacterium]|nr:hypothetical protein [Alcaligenaceae bacterium]